MRTILPAVLLLVMHLSGFAAVIHVPGDYPTIQDAIDASINGDIVIVDPGTYPENIHYKGKAITVKSSNGPTVTVIDGGQAGSTAMFTNKEGLDSVLEGFTLTNGTGTMGSYDYFGGGIFCYDASPTILRNIVSGNSAYNGGGMYCQYSGPAILDNIIRSNLASGQYGSGGGIYCMSSNTEIRGNLIEDNIANEHAGGIYCHDTDFAILENEIQGNEANGWLGCGGGMYLVSSVGSVSRNLIHENLASGQGGGIRCLGKTQKITSNMIYRNTSGGAGGGLYFSFVNISITNNTLFKNIALYGGGGITCSDDSVATVANTILWRNFATSGEQIYLETLKYGGVLTISYSDVEGGRNQVYVESGSVLNWGPCMMDQDPLFVDPNEDDFHLFAVSPCLNAGDSGAQALPKTDFEGDPMRVYGDPDLGADEFYPHLYWTGDAVPGGGVKIKLVGIPGIAPVWLCIGSGLLDPPLPSMWGDWYLQFPIMGPVDFGMIPSPDGILIFPGSIPSTPPPPYSIYMQALIGNELTNYNVLDVQ